MRCDRSHAWLYTRRLHQGGIYGTLLLSFPCVLGNGASNGGRWCGDNLATLDQLGRGIGPGSTIHRRGGHTQEPDLRDAGIPQTWDRGLAQAPVGVAWQLGSGIDVKLFPHQRPPLVPHYSSSRVPASSIAWRSVSGACAPDTAVRRLKIKHGTPWMLACRASRSARSTSARPSSDAR